MEQIREFLDTSTIHGMSWISDSRRWIRLFWIVVVIGGFTGAFVIIFESFYNWDKSPITTTSETLSISDITFPNVTVCPQENSFLNLNFNILKSEKLKLDDDTRRELSDYAIDIIQDEFHKEMMTNLSKLEYPERYYNWYHGFTKLEYPYYNDDSRIQQLIYYVQTSAVSGTIATPYFGTKLNTSKVEPKIQIFVMIYIPTEVKGDRNSTILFKIEKQSMKEVTDKLYFNDYRFAIDYDITNFSRNITAPRSAYFLKLTRKVSKDDVENTELNYMPGFGFKWYYNRHLNPETKYRDTYANKQYVR